MTKDFTTFALASTVPETVDVPSAATIVGSSEPHNWIQSAVGVNGSDVYIAGGIPSAGGSSNTDAWKLTWTASGGYSMAALTACPVAVNGAAGGVIGNKFYVVGGNKSASPYYSSAAYAYDLTAGTWSAIASFPGSGFEWAISCVYNGKLYVKPQYTTSNTSYSSTIYCYDPTTNTWSTVGSFTTASAYDVMWAYKGGIFLKVGYASSSTPSSTQLLRYDLATNTISTKASCPISDYGGTTAALVGGYAYYIGGNSQSVTAYRYDCDNDKWLTFPTPVSFSQITCAYFYGGTCVAALNPQTGNLKLFITGVYSSHSYGATGEVGYTPYSFQWEPRTAAPYLQNIRALKALAAA